MRVQVFFDEPSLTVQGFKDQCDLRVLMQRFSRVADFAEYIKSQGFAKQGQYGDFSDVPDYRQVLENIRKADESFMSLPENVRLRFRNDPASFLEFVSDPKNLGELKNMGLLNPESEKSTEAVSAETPPV